MPPPSLERKEQLLSWQQKDKLKGPSKPEDRPRRRNTLQLSPVPFTPEPKQNSYTEQFSRRRSQQELADQQTQIPRANGSRRMECRRSSEDADERRNDLQPLQQQTEENRQENGHHHSVAAAVDTAAEKRPPRTIEDVAAVCGKGSDCIPARINRDQRKATMTKKRRAPCCRSTAVLAVVAGVATVTVAGGLLVCQLHPSSPAAASIRIAVGKMEQSLVVLLKNEVMPLARTLEEIVREKGVMLLRSRRLRSLARAADALVEEKLRGSLEWTRWTTGTTVGFKLVEGIPEQLRAAVSTAVEVLKLSLEGIQVHMQTFAKFIEQQMGAELSDRVRSFLLAVLSSVTDVLRQCGEWIASNLDGFKPRVIDESLPSDQFLSLLEGNRVDIQSIGRGLTVQESQILQDVKRLEKHRVTIASDTNEILSKTREFALESVVAVKMAALDAIRLRLEQVKERFAPAIDLALKDHDQTSRQVEREGGTGIEVEIQVRVIAEAALKQGLMLEERAAGEKLVDLTVIEEQESSETKVLDESATARIKEERLSVESAVSSALPTEQGLTEDSDLGDEENAQIFVEVATEDQVTIDLAATLVSEPTSFDSSENEDLAGSASLENVLDGDRICEDEAQAVVENLVTDKEVETGEHSFVTEVSMDLDNGVVESTREKVTALGLQNTSSISEGDTLTQEGTYLEKDRLSIVVPGEGTDVKLDVEVEKAAYESTDQVNVEHVISEARTRIAIQPGLVEKNVEEQSDKLTPQAENGFVHEDILVASDIEIEIQNEKVDAEVILEVEKDVNEVDAVITVRERVREANSVLRHEPPVEQDTSPLDQGIAGGLHLEEAANAVREQEAFEAKVIQELEQLEQVLHVEEELRAIAKDEKQWSRIEQEPPTDEITKENPEQVEATKVTAEMENNSWRSSIGIPAPALLGPTLTQIGLFSVAFLVLAMLTAYLLVRYRKRGLLSQPPRRRRRWRKLADIDAEEVVLLPEVSSDEEGDKEQAAPKVDVLELVSSISVKTTTVLTSEDENADEEEKTAEVIEEEQGKPNQEEGKSPPDSTSLMSQTTVVELVQTAMEHTATPRSDASADSIDTTHVPVSTPPASRLQTPDTSQRTRRRRQIRT